MNFAFGKEYIWQWYRILLEYKISYRAFGKEYIWQWYRVDCTYKHNIESLFKHCRSLDQELIEEARMECGEDNWEKLEKWVVCGAPKK